MPGACRNPRWPAPQGRSNPSSAAKNRAAPSGLPDFSWKDSNPRALGRAPDPSPRRRIVGSVPEISIVFSIFIPRGGFRGRKDSAMLISDQMLVRSPGPPLKAVSLSPLRHERRSQISLAEALRAGHTEGHMLFEPPSSARTDARKPPSGRLPGAFCGKTAKTKTGGTSMDWSYMEKFIKNLPYSEKDEEN